VTAVGARDIGSGPAAYLEEVVRRVRDVLGEGLAGVWLLGSGALGDFSADRSDLDVQAVSGGHVALADRERLAALLSHDSLPCPARGLEFVLYTREGLHDPRGPRPALNLNTGERLEPRLTFDAGEEPGFWFVLDVSIGRERGRALAGPPAGSVLPRLPRGLVSQALGESLDWFAANDAAGAGRVLAACRTWAWAHDGHWRSKAESAAWARKRLTDPAPVDMALRLRDGRPEAPLTRAQVEPVAGRARHALAAARTP
jgi:hypothetical protein